MKKQEIDQSLNIFGITSDEVEKLYKALVKEAKVLWREDCIMDEGETYVPYLRVQLGYNKNGELVGRTYWKYSYMNADVQDWYYATKIDLTEKDTATAFIAGDYLYYDAYYQRTGKISQRAKNEVVKGYPIEDNIKSLEQVIEELMYKLV